MSYKSFAAIGTDGTQPVVWGLGHTAEEARADAHSELESADAQSGLVVVEIMAYQLGRIEAGCVDTESLGITLSRDDLREIAEVMS